MTLPRWRLRLAAVAVVATLGCSADGDRPGVIVLPGMHTSVPYDAHDPHPVFGQTLRLPPAGSVPHDAVVPAYGPGEEEAARAGREIVNPLLASGRDLERGGQVFETFCVVCHGPRGQGDGPIIGRFPNPASLTADHAKEMPDGRAWHVITHGQGLMAGYGKQVLPVDWWRVLAYLRSLQGLDGPVAPRDTLVSAPPSALTPGSEPSPTGEGGNHE